MTTLTVPGPPRPADTRPPGHPSAPPAPAPAPKPGALAYLWRDQWGRLAILATGTLGLATHYWTPALFLLALTARRRPGVRRRRNGAHRPQARCVPLPARRAHGRPVVAAPAGIATLRAPEIARGVAPR